MLWLLENAVVLFGRLNVHDILAVNTKTVREGRRLSCYCDNIAKPRRPLISNYDGLRHAHHSDYPTIPRVEVATRGYGKKGDSLSSTQ